MNTSNIEKRFDITSLVKKDLSRLTEILNRARLPGKFESSKLRLMIIADGRIHECVDVNGCVLVDGRMRALSPADFKALKEFLWIRTPRIKIE